MSLHSHILQSLYDLNKTEIDGAYRGKVKSIRMWFEKNYGDNAQKEFDKTLAHYIVLNRYNDFWTLDPGKFRYHLNVERPELFRCRRFEPSSIEEVKKVLEVL